MLVERNHNFFFNSPHKNKFKESIQTKQSKADSKHKLYKICNQYYFDFGKEGYEDSNLSGL
jgi:hypothetical protein